MLTERAPVFSPAQTQDLQWPRRALVSNFIHCGAYDGFPPTSEASVSPACGLPICPYSQNQSVLCLQGLSCSASGWHKVQ